MMNKTKAQIPAPPSRGGSRPRLMAPPPSPQQTPDNLSKPTDEVLRDLNFKVSPEFHRKFKMIATMRSMTMKELLEACLNNYVEKHGISPMDDLFQK